MTHYEVTIGWTKPDRAHDYVPYADGYRAGAEQHTETIEVEWDNPPVSADDTTLTALGATREDAEALLRLRVAETIASHVYDATNHPFPHGAGGLTSQIAHLVDGTGYDGAAAGHYSLSVGDTVTVGGVTVACAPIGWEVVR